MDRLTASHLYILALLCTVGSLPLKAMLPDAYSPVCALTIAVENQAIVYQEKDKVSQPDYPLAASTCGDIAALTFEEQRWDLGCATGGFTGYFATRNWQKIYGDGGVDVTGAPNDILVEGANSVLVEVDPGKTAAYRLTVPADGSISFDWIKVGGSNFFFSVQVNEREYPTGKGSEGFFFSDPLSPGDQFTLRVTTTEEVARLRLREFQFYTNAATVIRRRWKAGDTAGNEATADQFISLLKPSISQVIFPVNRDELEGPVLSPDLLPLPGETGFPVFDQDGRPATTSDQIPVDQVTYAYEISYHDVLDQDDRYYIIRRYWQVLDACAGNSMEHTQIIKQRKEKGRRTATATPTRPGKRVASTYPALPETSRITSVRQEENVFMDESCSQAISGIFIVE